MKITCIDDARSYERVLYALRSLLQGKAVRSYVDDIKRDLRAFYHRPDGCVKIITADYDSGWQLITLAAKTKEDADAEFNALYYRDCAPIALTSGLFQKLANTQENPSCHINGNGMSS